MGRPSKKLELTETQRESLNRGYETGQSHAYRKRCQMMLLKSETRSSEDIAKIVDSCEMAVNGWIKRYEAEGIEGLQTKPGRGRKAILNEETDDAKIKEVVKANRQRLCLAKAELEEALEKQFSQKTLERYIKNVLAVINASESVLNRSPVTRRMPISGKP